MLNLLSIVCIKHPQCILNDFTFLVCFLIDIAKLNSSREGQKHRPDFYVVTSPSDGCREKKELLRLQFNRR